jgi:hypothetical protein
MNSRAQYKSDLYLSTHHVAEAPTEHVLSTDVIISVNDPNSLTLLMHGERKLKIRSGMCDTLGINTATSSKM